MSKKSSARKPAEKKATKQAPDAGRRKLIWIGVGTVSVAGLGLAGWFAGREEKPAAPATRSSQNAGRNLAPIRLTPDAANAMKAAEEMLEHYTRDLNNASSIIHAVRGFGKSFRLADGRNAVEHLCSRYALDKEVNGRRYVYFSREAEVHENSFLKTFLEAGVGLDQPVTVGERRYTLRDVAESGKALFRCDPKDLFKYDADQFRYDASFVPPRQAPPGQTVDLRGELIHEHLPWGIIAFSLLTPPDQPNWTNAYGETIDWRAVLDRSLAEYEGTCSLGQQEMSRGEAAPASFRSAIKKYSCFGLHTAYSYLVALKRGYDRDEFPARLKQLMDLVTYRLKSDAEAILQEYAQEARGASPALVEAFSTRALVKLHGHAFEAINYARLHNLMAFTPSQERRIEAGQQAMYQSLVKLREMDWGMLRKTLGDKFISDIVIALGHAVRGMRLPTPQNPDAVA